MKIPFSSYLNDKKTDEYKKVIETELELLAAFLRREAAKLSCNMMDVVCRKVADDSTVMNDSSIKTVRLISAALMDYAKGVDPTGLDAMKKKFDSNSGN